MKFLNQISFSSLALGAILMGLAPFFPQPHLLEKFNMFKEGTLTNPMDIFDVFFHLFPAILLLIKYQFSPKEGNSL